MEDTKQDQPEFDVEDIHLEFASNVDQLNVMIMRGELTGSKLVADYFEPIKLEGKKYRTYAIFVDVMEESD